MLAKRVEFEYERFKILKMCESKDGLYGSSYEIEVKKNILNYFMEHRDFTRDETMRLTALKNILEHLYILMEERHFYTVDEVRKCILIVVKEKQ